ncbi:MAG: hypothetical protein JXA90_05455 [Planctomycetes bacterium]|nr:hypothetical protein [Planctomycetota bacterium]
MVIGVMGSGSEEHAEIAEPLGAWLAAEGFHLLTGGGRGAMAAVCRGFCSVEGRRGICIGILPGLIDGARYGAPDGYPNPWVEVAVRTHLPRGGAAGASGESRNPINILSSHLVVALPGGSGTASEVLLARRYGTPAILYLGRSGAIAGIDPRHFPLAASLEEVQRFVRDIRSAEIGPPAENPRRGIASPRERSDPPGAAERRS